MMLALATLLFFCLFILTVYFYMNLPMFGRIPSGKKRLERIEQSPHYRNGSFQNLNHTPALTEGVTY
ncbi:MAG: MBL fold metallo-hydrolase, partial [Bacteroidia bacterium]|nr:MBL fold metallo-hydrolase [Bacteroidia bacterium]